MARSVELGSCHDGREPTQIGRSPAPLAVFPEALRGELRQRRALLQHGTAISGQQQLPVNPPRRDAVAHHLLVKFT